MTKYEEEEGRGNEKSRSDEAIDDIVILCFTCFFFNIGVIIVGKRFYNIQDLSK